MPPEAKRAMMHGMGGGDDMPSVEMPKAPVMTKPKPNDSSISGQWYSDEAPKPAAGN
jgi:hypothetical protein